MKIRVSIESHDPVNPIACAFGAIIECIAGVTVTESAEEADVLLTNSVRDALDFLKEFEEARVLIALPPGGDRTSTEVGARSLAKSFPGRVYYRPMVERDGEQNVVLFLLNILEEMK